MLTGNLVVLPMSEVNKHAGKCQGKIHHVVVSEENSNAISEEFIFDR